MDDPVKYGKFNVQSVVGNNTSDLYLLFKLDICSKFPLQ